MNERETKTFSLKEPPFSHNFDKKSLIKILEFERYSQTIEYLKEEKRLAIEFNDSELSIRTYQYIGVIQFGSLKIIIEPKIEGLTTSDIIKLLFYAHNLENISIINRTSFSNLKLSLLDLVIFTFIEEVNQIIKELTKDYTLNKETLTYIRGRIDFNQLISNCLLLHKGIPCIYYKHSENVILNQILLSGIRFCYKLTQSPKNKQDLRSLMKYFDGNISDSDLSGRLFKTAYDSINRSNIYYRTAIRLLELLYENFGFNLKEGELTGPGFLFNMERFFQDVLAKFFTQFLPYRTFKHEKEIPNVFSYLDKDMTKKIERSIRPDYTITYTEPKPGFIYFDAKYMDLWVKSIPIGIIYQLGFYSLLSHPKYNRSFILYPTQDKKAVDKKIRINLDEKLKDPHYIIARPVDLKEIYEAVMNWVKYRSKDKGEELAKKLTRPCAI